MRSAILCLAVLVLLEGTAFSADADPQKPQARLGFAAELKKVQGSNWESGYVTNGRVIVQFRKGMATVGMYDKGGTADSTSIPAEAIEEGEERVIVRKTDKTRLFSYRLDGKELTVVFGEYLQDFLDSKGWDLPETVTLKSKGKK